MNAPCYKCQMRRVGCHGKCADYQEFYAANEITKATRRTEAWLHAVCKELVKEPLYG